LNIDVHKFLFLGKGRKTKKVNTHSRHTLFTSIIQTYFLDWHQVYYLQWILRIPILQCLTRN